MLMDNHAGNPSGPGRSISTPRGGSKPPIPPVPKLSEGQVKDLQDWARKHLPPATKK
jgi:hypothetical protein